MTDPVNNDEFVNVMETLYGANYLSLSGAELIKQLLSGQIMQDKVVADIVCGTGGGAMYIASEYPVREVIGIDVAGDLLERASKASENIAKLSWRLAEAGAPLPLDDEQIDLAFSNQTWLHITDKLALFTELLRVLKPGGGIVAYDWMHASTDYSNLLQALVGADELALHLSTLDEYIEQLQIAGFVDIQTVDVSQQALANAWEDTDKLLDPEIRKQIENTYDTATYDSYLRKALMLAEVFARGEIQCVALRARKSD